MSCQRVMCRGFIVGALLLLAVGPAAWATSEAVRLNQEGIEASERGDYEAAIAAFSAALRAAPDEATIRRNLAIAYNGRGVALIEAKSYQAAENYLLEAIRHQPEEALFRRNLAVAMVYQGQAFYERHDNGKALFKLKETLRYDPQNAVALRLLGEVCYEEQQLGWALYYLREAHRVDPERFAELEERIKQLETEATVEGEFARQDHGAFDLRYDESLEGFDLEALRKHLSDAYYGVGGQFGYYPRRKVVVLVYSPEDFARIRAVPEWVAGLYDGKIRVPAAEAMKDETMKRLIRHEYTHAVVGDLSKNRCAIWLNEGLAKYMEYYDVEGGMPTPLLKRRLAAGTLIPFAEMQGEFVKITGREKVTLAYEESYALVKYIVDSYGLWKIMRMLELYAQGGDTEAVLQREFHSTPARFEQEWLRFLRSELD